MVEKGGTRDHPNIDQKKKKIKIGTTARNRKIPQKAKVNNSLRQEPEMQEATVTSRLSRSHIPFRAKLISHVVLGAHCVCRQTTDPICTSADVIHMVA